MYKASVCILACVLAGAVALVGRTCTATDQCDSGECCQILSESMVMSRRQAPLLSRPRNPRNGTCQKYRLERESCYIFDKLNGYCSCEPGTTCNMYEVPLDQSVQVRMIVAPQPGYKWVSKCEKPSA